MSRNAMVELINSIIFVTFSLCRGKSPLWPRVQDFLLNRRIHLALPFKMKLEIVPWGHQCNWRGLLTIFQSQLYIQNTSVSSPVPRATLQVEERKPVPATTEFLLGCVLCKLQQSSLSPHPRWVWVFIKPLHRTPRRLTFSKRVQNTLTEYNHGYLCFPTLLKYFFISDGIVNRTENQRHSS